MKSIQVFKNGVRVIYSQKDCHSCYDCKNCVQTENGYTCLKISNIKRRIFPYDNTKCQLYEEQ